MNARKYLMIGLLFIALMLGACTPIEATPTATTEPTEVAEATTTSDPALDPDGDGKVTICHATGSATNPYNEISVNANAVDAHQNHADDIIPAPEEGCPAEGAGGTDEPTDEATAELTETDEPSACDDGETIAAVLRDFEDADDDDIEEQFTIFAGLLEEANLMDMLDDADREFTVFAPIDGAFAALDDAMFGDVQGNMDELNHLLLYHMVDEELMADDLRDDMQSVTAMNGEDIRISVDGTDVINLNETTQVVEEDIDACNGVIHAINSVLFPTGVGGEGTEEPTTTGTPATSTPGTPGATPSPGTTPTVGATPTP